MDIENILTVEDVARILQVKTITVREMFRTKRLRAFKMGKSWRTTKAMLEEDLVELAAKPPEPVSRDGAARRRGRPRKTEAAATAAPPVAAASPPTEAPPAEPKKRAARPTAPKTKDEDADDTQQLLF